jgi:hypothetical protein
MQEPGCRKQSECSPQQRGVPDVVHDGGDRPWQMGEIGRGVLGGLLWTVIPSWESSH